MTNSQEKRKERRRRKLFLAIIMIMFVGIVLTASTYAWFTANRTVTVESIDVTVSTSEGLQISVDASNWKSIVTNADIKGASWTGVKNQIPLTDDGNITKPVSTVGTIDSNGLMEMYLGTVKTSASDGDNILTAKKSTEADGNSTSGDFVVFDLFFRSSAAQQVYLTSGSKVVASDGSASDGIQNAARVAFINEGSVDYGATPATAQAKKEGNLLWIWEPNYDVHTEAGVSNALTVYGTTVGQTGGTKLAYKGVKAPIAEANNIKLNSTDSNYFGDVTTIGSLASGIPDQTYLSAFNLPIGITKIRIYMWIEGQDVDCEDRASGGSLTYDLQFSIDNHKSS